eukprot:9468723-Pyramimonas_sp.AAC.1
MVVAWCACVRRGQTRNDDRHRVPPPTPPPPPARPPSHHTKPSGLSGWAKASKIRSRLAAAAEPSGYML